jgi:excisionase family DNA binding protein
MKPYTIDALRRAVVALPPGGSLTLPREPLLEALGSNGDEPAPTDDLLTVEEAARLLKTDRRWVYRHTAELGAVHLSRRKLRIPRIGIERFIKRGKR